MGHTTRLLKASQTTHPRLGYMRADEVPCVLHSSLPEYLGNTLCFSSGDNQVVKNIQKLLTLPICE